MDIINTLTKTGEEWFKLSGPVHTTSVTWLQGREQGGEQC